MLRHESSLNTFSTRRFRNNSRKRVPFISLRRRPSPARRIAAPSLPCLFCDPLLLTVRVVRPFVYQREFPEEYAFFPRTWVLPADLADFKVSQSRTFSLSAAPRPFFVWPQTLSVSGVVAQAIFCWPNKVFRLCRAWRVDTEQEERQWKRDKTLSIRNVHESRLWAG